MYKRKRYYFPYSIEVEECHHGRYGAPGEQREKRRKATPEQIAAQNHRNKEKGIRRLIKANFGVNDYWLTLTYRREARPPDIKAARRDWRNFRDKLARRYKKLGIPLKWILAIEIGSRGGVHFHVILNRALDGDRLIAECWFHGAVHSTLLYEHGDFCELAEYISKQPENKSDKHYSHSKNLIIPKPKIKPITERTWKRGPWIPKGYYLDKESLREGENPVTGLPYRHYTLMKIRRDDDASDKVRSKNYESNLGRRKKPVHGRGTSPGKRKV